MAEPRKQYPFVVRVLLFAVIYTLLATVIEYVIRTGKDLPYAFSWEQTQRYFLIGICVAAAALLFFRLRKRNLPGR